MERNEVRSAERLEAIGNGLQEKMRIQRIKLVRYVRGDESKGSVVPIFLKLLCVCYGEEIT